MATTPEETNKHGRECACRTAAGRAKVVRKNNVRLKKQFFKDGTVSERTLRRLATRTSAFRCRNASRYINIPTSRALERAVGRTRNILTPVYALGYPFFTKMFTALKQPFRRTAEFRRSNFHFPLQLIGQFWVACPPE